MQEKSTITYWLRQPREENGMPIQILNTVTVKAPEVGEIINLNTTLDKRWLESRFNHLTEKQLKGLTRDEESQLRNDFIVVDVKRWLKAKYIPMPSNEVFQIDTIGNATTSGISPEIPVEVVTEDFEVYLEPFRHTELTETPIAKLRNVLGSIFSSFELLNAFKEHPEKQKELLEIFNDNLEVANKSIERARELLGNDKNWK